eukprot:scaffold1481_cov401-Prasinococcus_capsulatus_cf.AAC.18
MSSEQASFAMLGLSATVVRSLCTFCRLEVTTGRSAGPCGETAGSVRPALEGAASGMELVSVACATCWETYACTCARAKGLTSVALGAPPLANDTEVGAGRRATTSTGTRKPLEPYWLGVQRWSRRDGWMMPVVRTRLASRRAAWSRHPKPDFVAAPPLGGTQLPVVCRGREGGHTHTHRGLFEVAIATRLQGLGIDGYQRRAMGGLVAALGKGEVSVLWRRHDPHRSPGRTQRWQSEVRRADAMYRRKALLL